MTDRYFKIFFDEKLLVAIDGYDGITLACYDVKKLGQSTVCDQYCILPDQERRFCNTLIESARMLASEYSSAIDKLEKGAEQYHYNMFIMKKELFFRYCEFLFPILEDVEKKIDTTGFSPVKSHFLGYFGEFLLSIFCFKLLEEGRHKLKQVEGTFIISDKIVTHAYFKYMAYRILSKVTFGKLASYLRRKKMWYRQYWNGN